MLLETGKINETVFDSHREDTTICHKNGSINYNYYDQRARVARSAEYYSAVKSAKSLLLKTVGLRTRRGA